MFLMRIKPWVHGAFLCTLVMAFHGDVVAVEERPPEQGGLTKSMGIRYHELCRYSSIGLTVSRIHRRGPIETPSRSPASGRP